MSVLPPADPDSLWIGASNGRIIGLILVAVPVITYVVTSLRYLLAKSRARGSGALSEPLPVPFAIPVIGHAIPFLFNTATFLADLRRHYGTPLQLQVGGVTMYFVPHGDILQSLFKNSRQLSKKAVGVLLKRQFGMKEHDLQYWEADDTGVLAQPEPGHEHIDPSQRLWYMVHKDLQTLLMGTQLDAITAKYVEILTRRIVDNQDIKEDLWTELPDLYAFLRVQMLYAATESLCGSKVLELCPTFVDDFWLFDDAFPTIFKRVPRLFAPKAYAARDKMIENVKGWHQWASEHYDWQSESAPNSDWEPIYGSSLMRARAKMIKNTPTSVDGAAAWDLGFIWTANANVIPATGWAILDILRTRNLEQRVLAEIEPCFVPGSLEVNVARLTSLPLLSSIYIEELRLRAAATVTRQALHDDLQIDRWIFRKGVTIFAMPWLGGRDSSFWNTGQDDDPHPVSEFWSDRFLEYPGDLTSGPVRKHNPVAVSTKDIGYEHKTPTSRTAEEDRHAKLVTSGYQSHYFPYGGGLKICPGRFFAKQEMMVSIAVILQAYEIQLVDQPGARRVKEDMGRFPFGTLWPNTKVPFRIRKRKIG